LDAAQGTGEERIEVYLIYIERVPQPVTLRCAKSAGGIFGFAKKQASAAKGL